MRALPFFLRGLLLTFLGVGGAEPARARRPVSVAQRQLEPVRKHREPSDKRLTLLPAPGQVWRGGLPPTPTVPVSCQRRGWGRNEHPVSGLGISCGGTCVFSPSICDATSFLAERTQARRCPSGRLLCSHVFLVGPSAGCRPHSRSDCPRGSGQGGCLEILRDG